jgi:hypothetical protein
VGASDLLLGGTDEPAVADDVLAADDQPVDRVRGREDEPRDEVLGAAELEAVRAPDGEIGAAAGLDRAEVSPAQDGGAAARGEA